MQWYSNLKIFSRFDRNKSENIPVDAFWHMSNEELAETIEDIFFSKISIEFKAIKNCRGNKEYAPFLSNFAEFFCWSII